MIKLKNVAILILILISIQNCLKSNNPVKPPELIEFRTIEAGKTDSVSMDEIFFKDNYNLQFFENEVIQVQYDTINNVLISTPKMDFKGLTFIKFRSDGDDKVLPLNVHKKAEVVFSYKPEKKPKKMFVMGNFNNWSRNSDEMLDEDGDGIYEKRVSLDDGVYEYQFVVDKKEIYDPKNPEKVDNGFGNFNSLKRVESRDKQNRVNLYFLPHDSENWINLAMDTKKTEDIKIFVLLDNNLYSNKFHQIEDKTVKINLKPILALKGIHSLRIVATKNNVPGNVLTVWINDGNLELANKTFLWNDAVIYSVMPDRFVNGNTGNDKPVEHAELSPMANFKGGDLQGIIKKMQEGYFDSLGINTLWIFPLNKTTDKAFQEWPEPHRYYTGYHGYWPVEPRQVEPRFGTINDFKQLVDVAHTRNIKVLLDFISNHTHIDHPYYQEHPDWYGKVDLPNGEKNIRRWDEYRLTTWFDTFLPSFNYLNNPDVIEAVTNDAVWWIENSGIDGFRHDATKHVPHQFWKALTKKIKSKINPNKELDVYQIGETFGSHDLIKSYVNKGMLDAQFNFNQFFIARRIFAEKNTNFLDLSSSIEKSLQVYGYNHVMGNLMDSHDQVRMMALLDGDLTLSDNAVERAFEEPNVLVDDVNSYKKARVYFTYMLTIPGVPVIYYGDEFGMTGAGDPDNRRMMRFGEDLNSDEKQHLASVKELIQIRNNYSCLRRGDYKTLFVNQDVLVYMRGDYKERLIVVLNKSNVSQTFNLTIPDWIKSKTMQSLITQKQISIYKNEAGINIPAYTADIWKLQFEE